MYENQTQTLKTKGVSFPFISREYLNVMDETRVRARKNKKKGEWY